MEATQTSSSAKGTKGTMSALVPLFISVSVLVVAQLSLKAGMNRVGAIELGDTSAVIGLVGKVFTTPMVLTGVILYAVSSFFWLIALSKVDLSYAYPFVGLAYVAVAFFSWIFLGEALSTLRWAGIVMIVAGVMLVARS